MKVALIADTHGVLDEHVAERIAGSDMIVHAGDIGAFDVVRALRVLAPRVVLIRGNNDVRDKWPRPDWPKLEAIPWQAEVPLPGGTLMVVHGHRVRARVAERHDRLRALYPDARAIVYGHSHRAVRDTRSRPWILNPGAAGRARTFGGARAMILNASTKRWRVS